MSAGLQGASQTESEGQRRNLCCSLMKHPPHIRRGLLGSCFLTFPRFSQIKVKLAPLVMDPGGKHLESLIKQDTLPSVREFKNHIKVTFTGSFCHCLTNSPFFLCVPLGLLLMMLQEKNILSPALRCYMKIS